MRLANNKKIHQERNFRVKELVNQPSSLVIIDNRGDCQTIAIQHLPSSFCNTDQAARIMTLSFNEALKSSGLVVDIRRRIEENTFWNIVDRCHNGVKSVKFDISYPNLPRVSDNVDQLLIEVCRELGANSRLEMNAIHGQVLNLDKSSRLLNGLVKASSIGGHPIRVLAAGPREGWQSTGTEKSSVWHDMRDEIFSAEGEIFDERYELVAQEMNKYK